MNLYSLICFGYVFLCMILSVLVPCVRDNWKWTYSRFIHIYNEIKEPNKGNKFKELLDFLSDRKKPNKFAIYAKLVLLFIVGGLGFFLIFLIIPFYLYWLNKGYQSEKKEKEKEKSEKKNLLYHYLMGGAGTIICNDCDYNEKIVSFIHGDYDADVGYQCQSCGKFHTLESHSEQYHMINIVDPLVCSCGGELSCEKSVFCPKCKSNRMSYEMDYIT